MPDLPHSIELHDSQLAAVQVRQGMLTLELRPSCVHKDGKSWTQDADIELPGAVALTPDSELPERISDGTLTTSKGPYHNLLMLPLADLGPAKLNLELQNGDELMFIATSVQVRMLGTPKFVENFE
jgi:hypothetical protein